jgi:hypothetical protein
MWKEKKKMRKRGYWEEKWNREKGRRRKKREESD